MNIKISKLKRCSMQRQWGEQKEKVVCENGFHLLFDREEGCNKIKLKNLAKNTLARLGNLCKDREGNQPIVVFISGKETIYQVNWLAKRIEVYHCYDTKQKDDVDLDNTDSNEQQPILYGGVDLQIDPNNFFKGFVKFAYIILEKGFGITLEEYFTKFPLNKYPLPTKEDQHINKCVNHFYDEMKFWLSKDEALKELIKLDIRFEYLGYDYVFEYEE